MKVSKVLIEIQNRESGTFFVTIDKTIRYIRIIHCLSVK